MWKLVIILAAFDQDMKVVFYDKHETDVPVSLMECKQLQEAARKDVNKQLEWFDNGLLLAASKVHCVQWED